ncbi:MAG: pyridoxamine 5'-phosphate oxidase family protein [Phycisphaerae bacterium]|nr:pyridoxamine 5'-phosphate oxidase family protein [Tepidisphaeraceae bacterium]
MTTPPWLTVLQDELDLEYGARPRIAQLATVDERGRPRVRSVVCRRVLDDGSLVAASDGRSAKNAQVRSGAQTEWAFWLAGRRKQFRLGGPARVVGADGDEALREEVWRGLSDAARALFVWPAPGSPRGACDVDFVQAVPADVPMPASFELVVTTPDEVEMLDLNPHPHKRGRWKKAEGWEREMLNP